MGHAASRRHRRVARKSRYTQWMFDRLGSDLVEVWPQDEATGASEFTGEKAGKTATLNGTIALQQGSLIGGIHPSASYDGSTSYADAGDDSDFDIADGDPFSIGCWFSWNVDTTDFERLVTKDESGLDPGYRLGFDGGGHIRFDLYDGSQFKFSGSTSVIDGAPHLALATWDGTDAVIYVDGSQDASDSDGSVGSLSNSNPFTIGRTSGASSKYFGGRMSHTFFTTSVISASTVTDIYEQGAEFFDRGRGL